MRLTSLRASAAVVAIAVTVPACNATDGDPQPDAPDTTTSDAKLPASPTVESTARTSAVPATTTPPSSTTPQAGSAPPSTSPPPPRPDPIEIAWTNRDITPVSGAIDVGGVAVLYTREGRSLRITGLEPSTGEVLWSNDAGPGYVPNGIGLFPNEVGGLVAYLRPTEGLTARVILADPTTGRAVQTSWPVNSGVMPDACDGFPRHVCFANGSDDLRMRPSSSDVRPVPPASDDDLPDDAYPVGTHGLAVDFDRQTELVRFSGGRLKWRFDLESALGEGFSPAHGWRFRHHDTFDAFVGAVGQDLHRTQSLADETVFSVSARDGSLRWKRRGADSLCDLDLRSDAEKDPLLACEWTSGTVRWGKETIRLRGGRANVIRLDPRSGEILWRVRLGRVARDRWPEVSLVDRETILVDAGTRRRVIDVETGHASRPTRETVIWREDDTQFNHRAARGDGDGSSSQMRYGIDAYSPRTVDGRRSTVRRSIPDMIGASFDGGLDIVVSRDRVTAYRD